MSAQEIIKVDLTHFPTDERFAQIPGKLFLTDNLNGERFDNEGRPTAGFPVQVTMAVCFICLSGRIDMEIDLNKYTLIDGYTALILPGSFIQLKHLEEGTKCMFLAISPDFIKFIGNTKLGVEFGYQLKANPAHKLSAKDLAESIAIYRDLKKKLLDKQYAFKEDVAKSYLRILQCNIIPKFITDTKDIEKPHPKNRKEELFAKFISVVKNYYMENRSITFYADKLCVSAKYLSSVVHHVSGKYATELINQYVILEAKTMLRSDGISIKDVSNKLHFANQSFFAKFFKQHTGYTPKEYKAL